MTLGQDATAVKASTALAIPLAWSSHTDTLHLVFIAIGLTLAWTARAAIRIDSRATTGEVVRDFVVNVLIGGAFGLLSLIIIEWREMDYPSAAAVAFALAFLGLDGLKAIINVRNLRRLVDHFLPGEKQ